MKLQHQDFRGRDGRTGRVPRPSTSRRRTGLLFRYGALALVLAAAIGLKKYAGGGEDRALVGPPVATAGVPALGPLAENLPSSSAGPGLNSPGLDLHTGFRNYPDRDTFTVAGRTLVADYAADSLMQARIAVYLQRYRPDAAVVLACDLRTGRILGVGERSDSLESQSPRLSLRAGFPAASLIKILTATAALELKGKGPEDSIPQLGSYHTLYRRQLKILSEEKSPKVSLQEAFSRSVNPAFGVLGLGLGGAALERIAAPMGFNKTYACLQPSRFQAQDTGYALAETACGFTSKTTISPLHALALARGIGDDGRLRYGAFARAVTELSGKAVTLRPDAGTAFVSPANLPKLQALMEATVRKGTARKGFHQVMRAAHLDKLAVGGKTGSLDGPHPHLDAGITDEAAGEKGRYDWFIGYARRKDDPTRGVALSIMLVHGEYANVRSTVLAALLIRDWLAAEEKARKLDPARTAARVGPVAAGSPGIGRSPARGT